MNKTFPVNFLNEALDAAGHDPADVINEEYTGRGYASSGFALKLDAAQAVMLIAEMGRVISQYFAGDDEAERDDMLNELINLTDAVRFDRLGRSSLTYFPGWTIGPDYSITA